MAIYNFTRTRLNRKTKIDPLTRCWVWQGGLAAAGYGMLTVDSKRCYVHRLSYELRVGPIPEGAEIDHLCRNRACLNPHHLEPVSHRENLRRGIKGKLTTHCPRGHEYNEENTYFRKNSEARVCRLCAKIKDRIRYGYKGSST